MSESDLCRGHSSDGLYSNTTEGKVWAVIRREMRLAMGDTRESYEAESAILDARAASCARAVVQVVAMCPDVRAELGYGEGLTATMARLMDQRDAALSALREIAHTPRWSIDDREARHEMQALARRTIKEVTP